jgi:hypothetical protein
VIFQVHSDSHRKAPDWSGNYSVVERVFAFMMLLWILFAKFFVALNTSWSHPRHRRILTLEGCQAGFNANNPCCAWTRWLHRANPVISFTKSQN